MTNNPSSAETLEKMRKILHYINENDVVTWHALADKHLREVLTYCDSQAYLCLEQAEEIKRLRGLMPDIQAGFTDGIALAKGVAALLEQMKCGSKAVRQFGDDCIAMNTRIHIALSPQSK